MSGINNNTYPKQEDNMIIDLTTTQDSIQNPYIVEGTNWEEYFKSDKYLRDAGIEDTISYESNRSGSDESYEGYKEWDDNDYTTNRDECPCCGYIFN